MVTFLGGIGGEGRFLRPYRGQGFVCLGLVGQSSKCDVNWAGFTMP